MPLIIISLKFHSSDAPALIPSDNTGGVSRKDALKLAPSCAQSGNTCTTLLGSTYDKQRLSKYLNVTSHLCMRARTRANVGRRAVSWHAKCTIHLLISSNKQHAQHDDDQINGAKVNTSVCAVFWVLQFSLSGAIHKHTTLCDGSLTPETKAYGALKSFTSS